MPTPTQGQINKRFVSAIDPLLDNITYQKQLMGVRRNKQFLDIVNSIGGKKVLNMQNKEVQNAIYYSWFENALNQQIDTTGATIVGTGTASFTVSVLPAGSQGVLIVGDILCLPDGKQLQVKTVPTAASFTAITVDGTNATWTAGQYAMITSNAFESGSGAPLPKRWGVSRLSNVIQIIRDNIQITDVEMENAIRFEINGEEKIMRYESEQLRMTHMKSINGALFLGQLGSTLFSDASPANAGPTGNGIQITRGLEQYITLYGAADTVATAGTVVLADLEAMNQALLSNRAPMDFMIAGSTAVVTKYSNLLKNLGSSGVTSARLVINGSEVDLDVDKFNYGGFNYNLYAMGFLNNAEMVGSSATSLLPAGKKAFFIPVGDAPVIGGSAIPYIRTTYLPHPTNNSANRTINGATEEIMYGGLADTATSGDNVLNISMTSRIGLEVNNPQAFGAQTVLA